MSHIVPVPFSQGYVSTGDQARNGYDLQSGELVEMQGAYYLKNDQGQVWKMRGRTLFGSAGSTAVKGVAVCQFDEGGTDKLLAYLSTVMYAATPGTTGTFASLITGLNASATRMTTCHQDDRWYIGNGYDKNKVLMPAGTTRDMGIPTPQLKLTAVTGTTSGVRAKPTTDTGGFTNPTLAYDTSTVDTYSSGTLSAAGTVTHTWAGWASDASPSRHLQIRWSLSGLPIDSDAGSFTGGVGTGGSVSAGYNVTYLLEMSEDGGGTWDPVYSETRTNASPGVYSIGPAISDAVNSTLLQFRATLTYNSGTAPASLRIWDIVTQYGSTTTPFDTTGSMYYTYVWVNSNDANQMGSLQGAPADTVEVPAFTAKRLVTLTLTETPPTDATHWLIYRTVPGAANTIDNLGKLALVAVAQTTYADTFVDKNGNFLDPTVQLTPTLPAMAVGELSIPRDTQPPAFLSMVSWKGSVCGISRTNRRALRYSEAGLPESFPEFYVVSSFPLDEHDGLVGQMAVGETLVLLCEGAVLALDDLPRVVDGQFNGADARPLKGHPGCVGNYAYTTYSVAGEPRGAWVSPFGVYITNGQTCDPISEDLAWEEEVNVSTLSSSVLRWDAKNLILWFKFDSDGDGMNDREMPFHMGQAHSKGEAHPKLGQPTAKATSCMASALIGAAYLRFSGHPDNGDVYVEESGTEDAATSAGVSMVLKTGKIHLQKTDLGIQKATLIHSDFGAGETGLLTTTTYRDTGNISSVRTNVIDLSGHKGTTVFIGRAGEAVDFEFTYDGTGVGGILGLQLEVDGHGRSGSGNRWVSTSATP